MEEGGRLLAVDLSAVFHRNWHGGHTDSRALLPDGRGIWGITGTVLTILNAIAAENYTHLLIAAESHGSGDARREILPVYKAHRPAPDAELVAQMRDTWNLLRAADWPVFGVIRKEADDILASAASQYRGRVDILTGDRDLLATCSDRVNVLLFAQASTTPKRAGVAECRQLFGVAPEQVCEWKALAGDSSDGIPGVRGIGPRGASKILGHYGNLKAAYADPLLIGVPNKSRDAFRDGHDLALDCWRVARLDRNIDVADHWKSVDACFNETPPDVITRMGFPSLARQMSRRRSGAPAFAASA